MKYSANAYNTHLVQGFSAPYRNEPEQAMEPKK